MIAHNGEINTLRGNNNWMAARQASVSSKLFGDDISKLWPISYEGQSDTACFDNALEFLVQGGYSLAHAMMMMIPEAWAGNPLMDEERRAFYEYNAALMEPWDGPAAIAFTDGRQIGATLDRNGLAPGALFRHPRRPHHHGLRDGRAADPGKGHRAEVAPAARQDAAGRSRGRPPHPRRGAQGARWRKSHPYKQWLEKTQIVLEDMPVAAAAAPISNLPLLDRQQTFGYTQEDLKLLMTPMAAQGEEAVGSMGTDTPISALSDKSKLLFTYFKQNFAQVTNPPIDPIREEIVMSLVSIIGPRPNLFDLEGSSRTKRLEVRQPILTNEDLEKIRAITAGRRQPLQVDHARHDLAVGRRRGRHGEGARRAVRAGRAGGARRHQHHHPVRPQGRHRPRADAVAARLRGRAPPPDPPGAAHLGRPRRRIRRAARGASLRLSRRLRRGSDQPLSRLRDAGRDAAPSCPASSTRRKSSSATSRRSTRACSR